MKRYKKLFLLEILAIIVCMMISWAVVVGIVKILSWCFGFGFTIKLATGVWIVWELLHLTIMYIKNK